jgi:exodeoxyribonuclease V alpha subunit
MSSLLHKLARHGDISWLSYYFAEFVATQAQIDIDDLTSLSAALVCEANQAGNVCIDLESLLHRPLFTSSRIDISEIPSGAGIAHWCQHLNASPCVAAPNNIAPMTLDGSRLYLNRFWFYEDFIANRITAMVSTPAAIDHADISARLERLFGADDAIDQDQKQAVLTAASYPFSVISGGPGSGKTSTVIRILTVLLALDPDYRIALAAPTGKAAARMSDSIRQRIDQTPVDKKIQSSMPLEARTIHRLLRYRRNGFEYNELHQLPVDCVIIDEASMIDLKLMFHLLSALPTQTRLILLGDRDQLASVAAGNVLGDITGHGHKLDIATAAVAGSIALLGNNYRFGNDSAIGEIAASVNQGNSDKTIELMRGDNEGLRWFEESRDELHHDARDWLTETYQAVFEAGTADDALRAYQKARVLCATNHGPLGVDAVNHLVSSNLQAGRDLPESGLYSGLPIMITRNQHDLDLFNGDTGILWQRGDSLRACFRNPDGGLRELAVSRLPRFTPAWASTVHKSQGSEFDSVLLILPSDPCSDALSRELLYTAITRARRQFLIHAPVQTIVNSINSLTQRHSGLAQKLGWPDQQRL